MDPGVNLRLVALYIGDAKQREPKRPEKTNCRESLQKQTECLARGRCAVLTIHWMS